MLITVYTHEGYNIQVKSPVTSSEVGYTINHHMFEGQMYSLVEDAIDAINKIISKGEMLNE